ncbi:MAG TPA: TetR/AcrR family transcriptional regulator [Rugosibacter sp.]
MTVKAKTIRPTSAVVEKKPVRHRRKEARPSELMKAAIELFIERGYAATRSEDIAARAGVSKATLYLYFKDKEALFKAVITQGVVPILDEGAHLIDEFTGDSGTLLRELLMRWQARFSASSLGGIPKLMISEARNFPELALYHEKIAYARARTLLGRVIDRGVARGEFRSLDREAVVELIIAPMLMHFIWQHSMGASGCPTVDPARYLNTHLDLMLAGLAAQPKSKPPNR